MDYWDSPPLDRKQTRLFSPTLDAMIPQDHPVRLFDEILSQLDWQPWEARYPHSIGRPPIPPKVTASVILYGLSVGVRSSRRLEEACIVRTDFMWLTEGRAIDHSTICDFRTMFGKELKDTFRQVGRVAITLGLMRLNRIGLDGTRQRANSSRHATATAKTLQERLAALDAQIEEAFAQADAEERQDKNLFGDSTPNKLPPELAELKRRQERLRQAMDKAQAMDAKRQSAKGKAGQADDEQPEDAQAGQAAPDSKGKPRPAKVPVADPDSAVMPNKDGGHAPNYTPILTMDDEHGYIADADVDNRPTEGQSTVATVERIEQTFGERPKEVVADGAYADGQELAGLEALGVQAYVPVTLAEGDGSDNPAVRPDLARPVAQEAWDRLPRSTKGKRTATLDRSAFIYDEPNDCFWCPNGRKLERKDSQNRRRADGDLVLTYRYECVCCDGCPLSSACRQGKSPRVVQVDEYEPVRRRVALATKTTAGQAAYKRRSWICETPFALIKQWMNFRQFLLRGLEKVKTEWLWASTAYNLRKLVGDVRRMRVKFAKMMA
jgi:transposase